MCLHFESSFHRAQYGFMLKKSAVLQLIIFVDNIYKNLGQKKSSDISSLYVDFIKAFDKVSHLKLVEKISNRGIGGKVLELIVNYLTERKQRVKIGCYKSSIFHCNSGVPQGSILGPLMFLVYVNNLSDRIEDGEAFGYVDDFKVVTTSLSNAEKAASQIEKWSFENKLILNVDKTNILCIKGETQTNG